MYKAHNYEAKFRQLYGRKNLFDHINKYLHTQNMYLKRTSTGGTDVFAAVAIPGKPNCTRYTLTSGVECWDYWYTLQDTRESLGI